MKCVERRFLKVSVLCLAGCTVAFAQNAEVGINLNVKREVGGISTFDRSKFITIHANPGDSDWDDGVRGANNFTNDLLADFAIGRDVYFGRDTGGISWTRRGNAYIRQDSSNPGWVDAATMASEGLKSRNSYENDTAIHPYESRDAGAIMCAQYTGFWPNGDVYNGWAISTADTPSEPFGSATGDFMGLYLDHFYDNGGTQSGRPSPAFVEIINEPDWHILDWASDPDYGSAPASKIWRFHNGVADGIRAHNTESLIGGFVTTFPDHDEDNFAEWNDEWKSFIDIAGTNMDFWSLHLYDFPCIGGKEKYRKGANLEAMFDMIDYYSEATLGVIRPYVISEYGAQTHDENNKGWTSYRDWLRLKSCNSMVLTFMDRPHLMLKTIPFTVVKAEWGRNSTTLEPYGPRLMRQADEPVSYTGEWVYTDLVKFYDLWSEVKGTRIDIASNDPDIQTDAYVSGSKVYVILNNLVSGTRTINLSLFGNDGNSVQSVYEKSLYWNGSATVLDETSHAGNLSQVQVGSEGCVILEYTFTSPVNINRTMSESKFYASTYLKAISGGAVNRFDVNGVSLRGNGLAVLRLGIARDHALSKQPVVLVNGTAVTVPTDLMGFEIDDRFQYFGIINIPVPYELLQADNTVDVTFPDSGGHISTVALRILDEKESVKAWASITGSNFIISFSNATAGSWFALHSKTNLMDPVWMTNRTGLPIDASGFGSVTNPLDLSCEFFRIVESGPPAFYIEFTAPDYNNGALDGQQNWNAASGWMVGDVYGSGYISTADNNSAAVLNESVRLNAGESYSLGIQLRFGGSYATPTGYVYAFLGGLKESNIGEFVGTGGTAADANIQIITGTDTYRLLNNYNTIAGAANITGTQLNAGDILQFDYKLTLGTDAASTTYTVRLQNLTDGTDAGEGTVTGVDATIYSALTGSGAFGFFQSIAPGSNGSGLNGVQVDSVSSAVIIP